MPSIHTRAKKNQSCNGDVDQIRNNPKYSTWIIVEDCPSCLDIQYPEEQQEILCDVLLGKSDIAARTVMLMNSAGVVVQRSRMVAR